MAEIIVSGIEKSFVELKFTNKIIAQPPKTGNIKSPETAAHGVSEPWFTC